MSLMNLHSISQLANFKDTPVSLRHDFIHRKIDHLQLEQLAKMGLKLLTNVVTEIQEIADRTEAEIMRVKSDEEKKISLEIQIEIHSLVFPPWMKETIDFSKLEVVRAYLKNELPKYEKRRDEFIDLQKSIHAGDFFPKIRFSPKVTLSALTALISGLENKGWIEKIKIEDWDFLFKLNDLEKINPDSVYKTRNTLGARLRSFVENFPSTKLPSVDEATSLVNRKKST